METIIGINALKDEFRKGKLRCGDLRGLRNRFELSAKFGVAALQTYFYSNVGSGNERMELTADCYALDGQCDVHAYTMSGLVDDIKTEPGLFEVHLICLKWNKYRTDADRKEISIFLYKNK